MCIVATQRTLCAAAFSSPLSLVSCVTAKAHLGMRVRENKRSEKRTVGEGSGLEEDSSAEWSLEIREALLAFHSSLLFMLCWYSPGESFAICLPNPPWYEVW